MRALIFKPPIRLFRLGMQMAGYGVAFLLLHRLAAYWGNASSFSLWFPAAGLRFAFLWVKGERFGLMVSATELITQIITGVITGSMWWLTAIGTASSSLCYAIGIALVRRCLRSGQGSLTTAPMPLGLTMLICPLIAAVGSLPWALFVGPHSNEAVSWERVLAEAGAFWIGDLLGILMLAPPLLWLADRKFVLPRFELPARTWEALAVVGAGWAISALIWFAVGTVHIEAMLLCSVWVALRLGRMAAWIAGSLVTFVVLMSAEIDMTLDARAELHLLAASVSIASYLVGSYAEAERSMRQNLQRKERLLLRADRLKTLRAMSVAAIHDISQPLSTLSIEARYIRELADGDAIDRHELAATSAIIERKTSHLAELVRRMRLFGSDRADDPTPVRIDVLLAEVAALVKAEAAAAGTTLEVGTSYSGQIVGSEIELQQALVNLVRNAIAAAPEGSVSISAIESGDTIELQVSDNGSAAKIGRGMGLGLIIAQTIAEAHGGRLHSEILRPAGSRYVLILPNGGVS